MVLLDRNLQQPASIVDSITLDKAAKGTIAIYAKDVPAILSSIQSLIKYVDDRRVDEEKTFDLEMGSSKCVVKTEKNGSVNTYNIVLNTNTRNFKTAFVLVSHQTNKRAVQRLTMFMDYLRNNVSAMTELKKL